MKFTEKLKAKKADKIENPAKETAKKEKKPLKQKIKDSMNKKYIKNGSYSVVISAVFIRSYRAALKMKRLKSYLRNMKKDQIILK